ncbi:MAG: response regulator [Bacteroidia bacterium]|nr:response regulator [Bacteroidia bacterium]
MKKLNTIFLVDDDEVIVYLTNKLIASSDFCQNVENFLSAQDALDRLQELKANNEPYPDAILFDLNMPVLDGWQFIEAAQKVTDFRRLNFFVFTTSIDSADKNKALKYKMIKDFITKPLTQQRMDKIARSV